MTDFELNKAISRVLGFKYNGRGMMVRDYLTVEIRDYCNDWNDLMPLVVEYNITIDYRLKSKTWLGHHISPIEVITTENENPQRALAECLLKVLESNND